MFTEHRCTQEGTPTGLDALGEPLTVAGMSQERDVSMWVHHIANRDEMGQLMISKVGMREWDPHPAPDGGSAALATVRTAGQACVQVNLAAIRETGSMEAMLRARASRGGIPDGLPGTTTRAQVVQHTLPAVLTVVASRMDARMHKCDTPRFTYPD